MLHFDIIVYVCVRNKKSCNIFVNTKEIKKRMYIVCKLAQTNQKLLHPKTKDSNLLTFVLQKKSTKEKEILKKI